MERVSLGLAKIEVKFGLNLVELGSFTCIAKMVNCINKMITSTTATGMGSMAENKHNQNQHYGQLGLG